MGMTTSLVALALWGADPVAPPAESPNEISCEVGMLTVEGLGWRTRAYPMLKPAARQGSATIWTADRSLVGTLEAAAAKSSSIKAPRVTTTAGGVANVNSDKAQDYIQHVRRVADGPINGGTQVAYVPELATIREGFSAVFSGRKLDQGVLAQVKFAESHVGTLHTVPVREVVKPTPAAPAPAGAATPAGVALELIQRLAGPGLGISTATVQVPEVFLSEIQGEWLVPNDSVLLISMGVNTVADDQGKAVVQERLAILDFARPAAAADAAVAQAAPTPACRVDATTAVALENYANLSMPRVPDRSFPEAIDAEGKVHDLPPLPEAYAANDLNQISPGSPLATPQGTPITRPGRSIGDPQMVRASFEAIPDSEIQGWAPATIPAPPAGLAAMVESFLRSGMEPAPGLADRGDRNPGLFPQLPNGNATGAGPDGQEPFPNRSYHDIVTDLDESLAGRIAFDGRVVTSARTTTEPFAPAPAAAKCETPDCPAADCPYSAQACPGYKPAASSPATASKVEMGVSVRDGQGACVFNAEQDIVAALQHPGKAEVKFIPLGGGLSLQIEAKVVATPAGVARAGAATQR